MEFIETLTQRNQDFAERTFSADLKMLPSMKTIIVGCVDPRVDPADVFNLKPGEAVVIRNVAGRIDMTTLQTMAILRKVAQGAGKDIGEGWNLIKLHHTDCGISIAFRLAPDLIAEYLRVDQATLDDLAVTDPYKAVAVDVAALKANLRLPAGIVVTGVVYDVATGRTDIVVPSRRLRPEADA
ncbi:carbonic anhydrase [Methylobacterium sp. J-070]|uniref:carbonic anhydrase n=1 Tax=Methylobacterium sp. J-070 TaxID=2836650 RepID=UPI001FB99EEC|nr:carbonic anhydrase [Methylobacterium sp. J-070]MCJ2048726.1 hypothetical protein [Methylobacterium sp. J-070]